MFKYVLILLLLGQGFALVSNTHVLHDTGTTNLTDRSYDCEVAVSNDLVGFWCENEGYLFFHKKDDFLSGTLSNIYVATLNSSYTNAKSFKGNGDFIVASAFGTFSHFNVAKLNGNTITVNNWYINGYDPIDFYIGDYFFVDITERQSNGQKRWMVGLLSDTHRTVWLKTREVPSGLSVRELVQNNTARLYYTMYNTASGGFVLYKEDVDLQFTVTNESSESVGINCGTKIESNSQIVVLSCPSTSSATAGLISVYREDNLDLMFIQTYTSSSYWIGSFIQIVSSTYYVSSFILTHF
jgi:hypothetical protein